MTNLWPKKSHPMPTCGPPLKEKRKVIRETIVGSGLDAVLLVVCDDGTLWLMKNKQWEKLPDIPQN